jgi:hypothetical protein
MWSFGVLYYKIMSGVFPFDSPIKCKKDLFYKILHQHLERFDFVHEQDQILFEKILRRDGDQRITFPEVIHELKMMV